MRSTIFYNLILPLLIYTAVFLFYIHHLLPLQISMIEGETWVEKFVSIQMQVNICDTLLLCFSLFFIFIEFKQMYVIVKNGQSIFEYFTELWNYSDFGAPTGIIIFIFWRRISDPTQVTAGETRLLALIFILLFMKFLYFLRIVQELGHLVHMIYMCIYDMRWFLFLMLLFVFTFTDIFFLLGAYDFSDDSSRMLNAAKRGDDGNFNVLFNNFDRSWQFAYLASMGDWDTENYDNHASKIFLYIAQCLCTLLNFLVMLNLLIAIICETFARINESGLQHYYCEQAKIIANYLPTQEVYAMKMPRTRFLLMIFRPFLEEDQVAVGEEEEEATDAGSEKSE
jgi:hypothetical protein